MIAMRGDFGKYYVFRRVTKGKTPAAHRDWYLVKNYTDNIAYVPLTILYLPKEFIGKRIKLRIEVIEDG